MLTRNKFSFHLDFFFNWKEKEMSRQWCQKYIFLFIQIVQEMSWNFKKCCSFFTFFICKRRKLVVKIKTSLFFSVKTSNFLAGFYQPPTIISIRGSITIFRWGTHLYMSFFLSVCLSICCAPYLRNHTSSDHNFWYTYINDDISRCLFLIFLKIWFFGLLGR